jgi:hypothetical protein
MACAWRDKALAGGIWVRAGHGTGYAGPGRPVVSDVRHHVEGIVRGHSWDEDVGPCEDGGGADTGT